VPAEQPVVMRAMDAAPATTAAILVRGKRFTVTPLCLRAGGA